MTFTHSYEQTRQMLSFLKDFVPRYLHFCRNDKKFVAARYTTYAYVKRIIPSYCNGKCVTNIYVVHFLINQ